MNLGYCVVFDYMEQGWRGLTVVVCSQDLERAKELVENISDYPRDHERYSQEVFNLTEMYHKNALGMVPDEDLKYLKKYSPEAVEAILSGSAVDFSVQAHHPLGMRTWINRKWDMVTEYVTSHLRTQAQLGQDVN